MIFTYLTELVECLKAELQKAGLPDVCFLAVVAGEAAAEDYMGDCDDKNGMGWVRLVTSYPATQIGQPDVTPGNCSAGIGADVEIGMVRLAPVPDERGNMPEGDEQTACASLVIDDMLAMFRAIRCCNTLEDEDVIVGPWLPLGPEGGVTGGVITLSVAF